MNTPLPVGARTADRSRVQSGPLVAHLVQAGWLILLTGTLAFAVAATPTLHAILQTTCPEQLCLPLPQPTADSVVLLQRLGVPLSVYAKAMVIVEWTYMLLVVTVTGTIVWKRPLDPGGVPVAFVLALFAGETFLHVMPTDRPELGLVPQISTFVKFAVAPAVLVRFPDGRWVPSWSKWVALAGLALAALFAVSGEAVLGRLRVIGALGLWSAVLYALIWRYRFDSDTTRRQQTKWLLLAGGMFVVAVALSIVASVLDVSPRYQFAIVPLIYAANSAVMLALGFGILRYRLLDIDVFLNRALVYGGATTAVVCAYVAIVGLLSALLRTDDVFISLIATSIIAVLFQPMRERLQRAANRLLYGERDEPYSVISRLGQRLEAALAPAVILPTIVETVASALRLPYAAVALEEPSGLTIAASTGRPPADPLRVPLSYQGEAVGELLVAPRAPGERFSAADRRLIDDLARQASIAAHAARLADESRQLAADLQLSRERLVLAREEERRRLRRDLHDGLGPRLAGLTLRMETARDTLAHDPVADALLAELATRTAEAVADVRRVVYALRPPSLDELGLVAALQHAVDNDTDGQVHVVFDVPVHLPALPAAVEVAAYRIAQEALTNVWRHASARTCKIQLVVDSAARELKLLVDDDGCGIPEGRRAGVGLHSMRERASELGGRCEIGPRPEGGTRVYAALPIHSPQETTDG